MDRAALAGFLPEFAGRWERHEVAKRFEDHKTIEPDCQALFTEARPVS
jgi:hypothetical protein